MDFTLKKYSELLDALSEHLARCKALYDSESALAEQQRSGSILPPEEQQRSGSVLPPEEQQRSGSALPPAVLLRHDVDLHPERSLAVARIEAAKGWKAVYYFRAVPESWDEDIIRQIKALGHEIGYHYESLTTCRGDVDAAWEDFKANLSRLREVVAPEHNEGRSCPSESTAPPGRSQVHSICMHGSPRSPWDSRDIWNTYDYRAVGVDFEPYLDTDWSRTFYLTDTGRRWDGWKVSVRDKIPHWQDHWAAQGLVFHSTDDIIRSSRLPSRIMITTHPQRWIPFGPAWCKEFILQNVKNIVKRIIIR